MIQDGVSAGEIGIRYSHIIRWDRDRVQSQYQPNITVPAKYHNISKNITISAKYPNFDQISQFQPNLTISAKSHNFSQISQFWRNFTISANFFIFLWITPIPQITNYQGLCFDRSPTNVSKLPEFPKLPITPGPSFNILFYELLKFPEIPITRASDLTFLQPCPCYSNSPKYQFPRGPSF